MSIQVAGVFVMCRAGILTVEFVQFQSNGNGQVAINMNLPVTTIRTLQFLFNTIMARRANEDVTEPFFRFLELAFRVISNLLGDNGPFRENLLVMDIDVGLYLGDNPLTVSNRFNQHNITLVVVSVETFKYDVSNYYRESARGTGGEYMLLMEAPDIFKRAISATIYGEDTLRQAFLSVRPANASSVIPPTNDINEHVEETDGVGDLFFNHGLPQ